MLVRKQLQAAVAGHGEPRWPRPDLRAGHNCESEKTWDGFLAPPPTHAKPSQPRCRLVCKRLQTWRLLAPARPNCGDGPFPLPSRTRTRAPTHARAQTHAHTTHCPFSAPPHACKPQPSGVARLPRVIARPLPTHFSLLPSLPLDYQALPVYRSIRKPDHS